MKATIYHNPQCSKSRETLRLLEENNVEVIVREYLKEPLTLDELHDLMERGLEAQEMVRTKEDLFRELKIDIGNTVEIINAIHHNPILLERPVVIMGEIALLGRPPENVLRLLN